MNTKLTFLAPVLFTLINAVAVGQTPGGADPFKKFDVNGDGNVTSDELPNPQAFERFDKNMDGVITRDEFRGAGNGGGQLDAMIKAADKDQDGKITKAEAGDAPWFGKLDQNKDDVIDEAELKKARELMGGRNAKGTQLAALLKKADKNGDGKINKAEAGNAAWFAKLDQNKDDMIDAQEIEQALKMAASDESKPGSGARGGQFEAMLKRADKDGNGEITREEAGDAPWFDKVDQNSDDVLDAEELDKLREATEKRAKS